MAKTLLEITQYILEVMKADKVNSITDTEESETVAGIVVRTYQDLMSNSNWHSTRRATQLEPYSDSSLPTHLSLPEDVKRLISIFYDKRASVNSPRNYVELKYKDPDDFLRYVNMRNSAADNTEIVVDPSGIELLILNDKGPEYYTSFDDVTLVVDSYDSEVDSTIQSSKVQAQVYVIPSLALVDDAEPDLPPDAFSLLENEALSRAQMQLREFQDVKAETESRKQSRFMSRQSWRTNGGIKYPDYGWKR